MSSVPISDSRLERVRVATAEDPELSEVLQNSVWLAQLRRIHQN